MQRPAHFNPSTPGDNLVPVWLRQAATWLLLTGLLMVTAAQIMPALPLLTGLGLLMLGATVLTVQRLSAGLRPLVLGAHLAIYLLLYALFLAAVIDHGTAGLAVTPAWLRLTDMGLSALLVVGSLKVGLRGMEQPAS